MAHVGWIHSLYGPWKRICSCLTQSSRVLLITSGMGRKSPLIQKKHLHRKAQIETKLSLRENRGLGKNNLLNIDTFIFVSIFLNLKTIHFWSSPDSMTLTTCSDRMLLSMVAPFPSARTGQPHADGPRLVSPLSFMWCRLPLFFRIETSHY